MYIHIHFIAYKFEFLIELHVQASTVDNVCMILGRIESELHFSQSFRQLSCVTLTRAIEGPEELRNSPYRTKMAGCNLTLFC